MKSKQYPYGVNVIRTRVNLSIQSSQLYSNKTANRKSTGRQMLKNKAQKESTLYRERQWKNLKSQISVVENGD